MIKLGLVATLSLIAGTLTFAQLSSPQAQGVEKCKRTEYKTQILKEACEKGGQPAAKDAMKKWSKEKGIKSCNQCHTKLAPNYELKPDGLDQFVKKGGKLLDAKPATKPATKAAPKAAPAKPATK